jgi:hypothetical protein
MFGLLAAVGRQPFGLSAAATVVISFNIQTCTLKFLFTL